MHRQMHGMVMTQMTTHTHTQTVRSQPYAGFGPYNHRRQPRTLYSTFSVVFSLLTFILLFARPTVPPRPIGQFDNTHYWFSINVSVQSLATQMLCSVHSLSLSLSVLEQRALEQSLTNCLFECRRAAFALFAHVHGMVHAWCLYVWVRETANCMFYFDFCTGECNKMKIINKLNNNNNCMQPKQFPNGEIGCWICTVIYGQFCGSIEWWSKMHGHCICVCVCKRARPVNFGRSNGSLD